MSGASDVAVCRIADEMEMLRQLDKYGRGSAAVNGAGFVDLEPGGAKQETSILTYTSRRNRANSRRPSLVVGYGSIRGESRQWACGIMIGVDLR